MNSFVSYLNGFMYRTCVDCGWPIEAKKFFQNDHESQQVGVAALLKANGVSNAKAFTIWAAVRVFSWPEWDNSGDLTS